MQQSNDTTIQTVDITPTRMGLDRCEQIFRETIVRSQKIIERCDEVLKLIDAGDYVIDYNNPEGPFLTEAVEAYRDQEARRIVSMQEGLKALGKEA